MVDTSPPHRQPRIRKAMYIFSSDATYHRQGLFKGCRQCRVHVAVWIGISTVGYGAELGRLTSWILQGPSPPLSKHHDPQIPQTLVWFHQKAFQTSRLAWNEPNLIQFLCSSQTAGECLWQTFWTSLEGLVFRVPQLRGGWSDRVASPGRIWLPPTGISTHFS